MDSLQALILGLVQGLTEYLPVSSSGHLEIGKMLLGIDPEAGGLTFDIVVHVATVLATLVILWKEVFWLFGDLFKKPNPMNEGQRYVLNIIISMIPVGLVGFLLKDTIEGLYEGDEKVKVIVVGCCLLLTAALLSLTHFYQNRKEKENISPLDAFIIGIAQACAVLPGLSRSGSTIATGLLLGNSKKTLAQFSFLMVIPPILGEALLDFKHIFAPSAEYLASHPGANVSVDTLPLLIGFAAAFVSGCFACKWMISLVKKCKLIYFGIYCALAGLALLIFG
ncbi:MAG: undecaprenyl-diphosphate phosphatase [Bacteroidaceae bacterium]|nr:undecaprenyl-diphosphate phosphatase [Bacteroidaceae bacterium]